MRNIREDDLIGKTIVAADCESVNATNLTFEDGTKLTLWVEQWWVGSGLTVGCVVVDEREAGE